MKTTRIITLAVLLAMMCFPGITHAQHRLTVYDDEQIYNSLPAYMYYWHISTKSQFIIPAADLTSMNGNIINSITFYTTDENVPYTSESECDVYLKEVPSTTLDNYVDKSASTIVYSGTVTINTRNTGGTMTITFSTPYNYNGGNLLIGIENTTNAGNRNIHFYGQWVSYTCGGSNYSNTSLDDVAFSGDSFIPKTTFDYSVPPAVLVIGDTTESSEQYSMPVNTYFNYSLTETIIDASEIGRDMNIGSISYRYAHSVAMTPSKYGVKIWIKPTSKTHFVSDTDMEPLDNTAVLVYDGTMACSAGWNTITFTTPYYYNGSGNLMVIVCDTVNGFDGQAFRFYTSSCDGFKVLSYFSDDYIPDPTTTAFDGTTNFFDYRPQMMLGEGPEVVRVTLEGPTSGVGNSPLEFVATGTAATYYTWYIEDEYLRVANENRLTTKWLVEGTYKVVVTANLDMVSVSDSLYVTIERRTPETSINSTTQWYGATKSYGAHSNCFVKFMMQRPEEAENIADYNTSGVTAAEYADGDVYIYDYSQEKLYRQPFDEGSPFASNQTEIGSIPNKVLDMSYNVVDSTMYGIIATTGERSQLVKIDLNNGTLTSIGNSPSVKLWTLAIDGDGNAYSLAQNGFLYSVNLADGRITEIGSTELSVNYNQSMSFDRATGELYWAQDGDMLDVGLYKVNTSTGHADFVGYFGNYDIQVNGLFNTSMPNSNGVSHAEQTTAVELYPNPATDKATLTLNEACVVTLHDITGRELYRAELPAGQHTLDLTPYPAGTYFLRANGTTLKLLSW